MKYKCRGCGEVINKDARKPKHLAKIICEYCFSCTRIRFFHKVIEK